MEQIEIRVKCSRCGAPNLVTVSQTQGNVTSCSQCRSVLLEYEPVKGYLYVLSNDQMHGLVKIGFSTRPVEERVAELNSGTAVPAPFVIEGIFPSSAPERHEQEVHDHLATARLPGKEFFKTALPEALRAVAQACGGPPKYVRTASLLINPPPPARAPESSQLWCSSCGAELHTETASPERMYLSCPECGQEEVNPRYPVL